MIGSLNRMMREVMSISRSVIIIYPFFEIIDNPNDVVNIIF